MSLRLIALALVALWALPASAQVVGRVEGRQATPGGYFVNARAGEPTTRVYVWGTVRNPGVYEVGSGFDVQSVLSLSGLPVQSDRQPGDPEVYVRVYRPGSGGEAVYAAPIGHFVLHPDEHPALREGDVLTVGLEPEARVNVWGAVRLPGLYEVGPGFDVQSVLSLAGGPLLPALRNNDTREVTVRYVRGESVLFAGSLEDFTRTTGALPMPQDGDVVEVITRERAGFSFRDVLAVAGTTAGIVSAVAIALTRF